MDPVEDNYKRNIYSHFTAKERDNLSFSAKYMLTNNLLVGEVLDFGCGYGRDVELLKDKGISIVGYDPCYFPKYPIKKFDTIICFDVLNVLMQEEQSNVMMEISQLIKPTGKAYYSVRRDIQFEGFRTHKIHQKQVYHCNVKLGFTSIFANENLEIYEYRHYNQLKRKENPACPFCNPSPDSELIMESATAFAIYDNSPANDGHALIIPKKHCAAYFDLPFKEQSACWYMLNYVQKIIKKKFTLDGFNIGVNINAVAGQTEKHVHIDLIPRYKGDVENPAGGVRNVLRAKGK